MQLGIKICGIIAIVTIVLSILFILDPEKTLLMPKCPFYVFTGLKCPSCGIQRAIHSLLHFEIIQAIKYNFFLVLSIPYAVLLVIVTWLDPNNKMKRIKSFCYSNKTVYSYLFVMMTWCVVRNIINI